MIAHPPRAAGPRVVAQRRTSGFRSFVGAARKTGTSVVVLTNSARSVDRLRLGLLKALSDSAG